MVLFAVSLLKFVYSLTVLQIWYSLRLT